MFIEIQSQKAQSPGGAECAPTRIPALIVLLSRVLRHLRINLLKDVTRVTDDSWIFILQAINEPRESEKGEMRIDVSKSVSGQRSGLRIRVRQQHKQGIPGGEGPVVGRRVLLQKLPLGVQPCQPRVQGWSELAPKQPWFVLSPFQQIGECVRAHSPDGNRGLIKPGDVIGTFVRSVAGHGFPNRIHPLTQPLPPILRLPRSQTQRHEQPNEHRDCDPRQIHSSLPHGENMPCPAPEASRKAAMECGDLSPLSAPGDLSPGRARPAPGLSCETCAFLRSTATSRLDKAVTSHRTPKFWHSSLSPFRVFRVFRGFKSGFSQHGFSSLRSPCRAGVGRRRMRSLRLRSFLIFN